MAAGSRRSASARRPRLLPDAFAAEAVMRRGVLICVMLAVAVVMPAQARPFIPDSDGQVLERLPLTATDPVYRKLGALRGQLKNQPDNLPLALTLARGYADLGRSTGDPRYLGYAQAALAPWWNLVQAPPEAMVLRAFLLQTTHQFAAALADLAKVLHIDPRNAEA